MEHLLIYPLLSTRDCGLAFFALHLFRDFLFLTDFCRLDLSFNGAGISSSDSDSPDCSFSESSAAVVIAVISPDLFLLLHDDSP